MKLDCFFKNPAPFTVGELKTLLCRGENISQLASPASIHFQEESLKYSLHVVSLKPLNKDEAALQVTSYKTGQYNNQSFQLVSGSIVFPVKPLSWEVSSVLTSPDQKLFPPYGPWGFSYPVWYKISWLALLIIVMGVITKFTMKKFHQKKLRKRISGRLQGKTPVKYFIDQLSQFFIGSLKNKENGSQFFTQLNLMLREFLENQFEIPVEWSFKKIKKQKLILKDRKKMLEILSEIETALDSKASYSEEDREQLLDMARQWVFQFDKKNSSSREGK